MTMSPATTGNGTSSPADNDTSSRARTGLNIPVVGVGASAGGLEAFLTLVRLLPEKSGLAFVLVQHLDPSHKSSLVELLSRQTRLSIVEAEDGVQVAANRVYVIPPNTSITIRNGHLYLAQRDKSRAPQLPIDDFFHSLAEDKREKSVGIVLSGTGSDGTLGIAEIKAAGGITFAQKPATAKYDSMPRAAIYGGKVDFVLTVEQIVERLCQMGPQLALTPGTAGSGSADEQTPGQPVGGSPNGDERKPFEAILRLLHTAFGVDFSQYRETTIRRRILRRMVMYQVDGLEDYAARLQDDRDELEFLYEDMLINVTSFFRDPDIFDTLAERVFPQLVDNSSPGEPIRIWVAGCSMGQEPYSLAIALTEFLEERQLALDMQLFATDLSNTGSLAKARDGLYPENIEAQVSPRRLRRFFRKEDGGYRISKSIRDLCVFARQNIAVDPPFSRLDMISCRNVLIYLSAALQKRIIPSFHYALNPGGYLLLGSSESVSSFTDLFEPADKEQRIFVRKHTAVRLYPHFTSEGQLPGQAGEKRSDTSTPSTADWQKEADRVVMGDYAPAGVLVNSNLDVLQFRGRTSHYLEPAPGEASFNLLKMAREGLFGELKHGVGEARKANTRIVRRNIRMRIDGLRQRVDLTFVPLHLASASDDCVLVLFERSKPAAPGGRSADVSTGGTAGQDAGDAAPESSHDRNPDERKVGELETDEEIRQLRRELRATREHQQTILEEKEVANEELQTANEEVLSANEELQSTNEELETAKEELQSLNEELTTVNEQLQNRNQAMNQTNNDLINFFDSTRIPIVMVDRDMRLRRFTPAAEKLLYLNPQDIGRPISSVRLAVEIADIEKLVASVSDTMQRLELEVQDRDGYWYVARIRPYRTADNKVDGAVIALTDIDEIKQSQQQYRDVAAFADAIVSTLHESLLVLDEDMRVLKANEMFLEMFQVTTEETEGQSLFEIGNAQWDIQRLRKLLEDTLTHDRLVEDYEVEHVFPLIGQKTMLLNARQLRRRGDSSKLILLAIDDVTEQRRLAEEQIELRAQQRANEAQAHLAAIVESTDDAIISIDTDGIVRTWNQGAERMFGYSDEEMAGQSVDRLPAAETSTENQRFLAHLLQAQEVGHCETVYVDRDGATVDVSLHVCPMYDETGAMSGASVIARDISAARRAANELERADRRKDEFVAVLAHELRNPLAAVSSAVELLGTPRGLKRLDSIQGIITRQTDNLVRLVDDLLDMSRVTTGVIQLRMGVVDLCASVDSAVETVSSMMAARGHTLDVSVQDDTLLVEGDVTRLEQVLVNLLTNSAKYTEPGGHIELRVERDGEVIEIRVRDNGVGISRELLPDVFEVFSRTRRVTDPEAGGLGIGLTLVKSLVELHRGSVEARSDGRNQGSEFIVRLPALADAPVESRDERRIGEFDGATVSRRILVVDDNEDAASALAQLLEAAGHTVQVAHDGPSGLDAAISGWPQVVLLDLSLPRMDGHEVATRIRQSANGDDPLLIAVSGFCQETDRQRSRDAGFDHHMAKPANLQRLLELITESAKDDTPA